MVDRNLASHFYQPSPASVNGNVVGKPEATVTTQLIAAKRRRITQAVPVNNTISFMVALRAMEISRQHPATQPTVAQ